MVVPHAPSDTRLDEYDQIEWWDVARRLHPAMTWEQFQADWDEFVRKFGKSSANAELTSRVTSRPPRG
jgi:hypothetical protein